MSSNEGNGIMDVLAKKLFQSPSSPFSEFADQQRAERLASCQQLEKILTACQTEAKSGQLNQEADVVALDDRNRKSARKLARFFQWDSPQAEQNSDNPEGTKDNEVTQSKSINQCHREAHELWACRALALGCGGYLKDLREVWDDEALVSSQKAALADSSSEISFYQQYNNKRAAEEREIQQKMASCVTRNAKELAERMEARRNKK